MRELLVPVVLISLVLAVPIVPFLLVGDRLDAQMRGWPDAALPPRAVAAIVFGLLAGDVFLPVPSSAVSTFGGDRLGFWVGTAVSWGGMTVGALAAFALARWFGRPLALWLSRAEDLARMDVLSRRWGPLVLVLARPVPVMAEASVLLLGTTDLGWRRFLAAVALSNLYIAAAYAALGHWVQLPVALALSIALPVLAGIMARRWWPKGRVR